MALVVRKRNWTTGWPSASAGSGHGHLGRLRGPADRGVGEVAAGEVRPVGGGADAVLGGELLHCVVGVAIDVAHDVGERRVGRGADRREGEHEAGGVGGTRALQPDDRVGQLQFGHAAVGRRLDRLASTSTAVAAPATTVRGSVPAGRSGVEPPWKPTTPGTSLQSSSVAIRPVSAQSWPNGTAWGTSVAAAEAAMTSPAPTTASAATAEMERRITVVATIREGVAGGAGMPRSPRTGATPLSSPQAR